MTMTESLLAGKPIPSLQSLDSNERVIYMGTFQNLFTFFTNGICCFTTTPFKTYQELYGIFKQTVATIQQLAF